MPFSCSSASSIERFFAVRSGDVDFTLEASAS